VCIMERERGGELTDIYYVFLTKTYQAFLLFSEEGIPVLLQENGPGFRARC
jgi:hypothetical protein